MNQIDYDREAAVAYARKWAYSRNPEFYNFDGIGGDCTNFVSQCIFAGSAVMNFTPVTGWYYNSPDDRAAAWTGVEFLRNFLVNNSGLGPFAAEIALPDAEIGDVIQLGRATGDYYHTLIISGFSRQAPLVASHTFNAYDRPLSTYVFERVRSLHILGVRVPD